MKKIVSLMALCAVLFGAVLLATGCGSKPAKGSVWKVTKCETKVDNFTNDELKDMDKMYYCFHADGFVYKLSKAKKATGAVLDPTEIVVRSDGYLVKGKELIWGGKKATISDKAKDTLTFTYTNKINAAGVAKDAVTTLVMKASTDYKADEIRAKVGNR